MYVCMYVCIMYYVCINYVCIMYVCIRKIMRPEFEFETYTSYKIVLFFHQ